MALAVLSLVLGLVLLAWSAGRFVEGAAFSARYLGVPPLLVGMVVVGFGTSAPELVVSAMVALQGKSGLALGNAYGSNIANIGLVLGLTAVVSPVAVRSGVLRRELPLLVAATALAVALLWDRDLSRWDAAVLLTVFGAVMAWTVREGLRQPSDPLAGEVAEELATRPPSPRRAAFWLLTGLVVLAGSSRLLVWAAVYLARELGLSDLVIGLTVVAVGTSLPELASAMVAARRGEPDLAVGNVVGSNLFNTLAVVGIAGAIHPAPVPAEVIARDMAVMAGLTVSLFGLGYGLRGHGRINRVEGLALCAVYAAYVGYLVRTVMAG
jgi:cation:H+ antiporter